MRGFVMFGGLLRAPFGLAPWLKVAVVVFCFEGFLEGLAPPVEWYCYGYALLSAAVVAALLKSDYAVVLSTPGVRASTLDP